MFYLRHENIGLANFILSESDGPREITEYFKDTSYTYLSPLIIECFHVQYCSPVWLSGKVSKGTCISCNQVKPGGVGLTPHWILWACCRTVSKLDCLEPLAKYR